MTKHMEEKKSLKLPTREEFILAMRKYKERRSQREAEMRARLPEIEERLRKLREPAVVEAV